MNKIITIVGPTAVGKTKFSIELAKQFNGEIISGDSMQVYKGMNIGTAKVTKEEAQGIPHHLIDVLWPNEVFNASIFKSMAQTAYQKIIENNKLPILAGGTGLYVNGFLYDYHFSEAEVDENYRKSLEEFAQNEGLEKLYEKLEDICPEVKSFISKNDKLRIIRTLEIYHSTGKIYFHRNDMKKNYISKFELSFIGLTMDRDKLYKRINQRVDKMIDLGLIEEIKSLLDEGYSRDLVAFQGIGYKEIIAFLNHQYSLETAIELIKKNTRNFAKRQLTWFRRDPNIKWINIDEKSDQTIMNEICSKL